MMLTHKGWSGFCPVYLGNVDDESQPLIVMPRHWSLLPVLWLTDRLEELRIGLSCMIWPDYEPMFMVMVTGKLNRPRHCA